MILFIWVSIHKPQVDKERIVKNNFMFRGRFIVERWVREVVISNILIRNVFM